MAIRAHRDRLHAHLDRFWDEVEESTPVIRLAVLLRTARLRVDGDGDGEPQHLVRSARRHARGTAPPQVSLCWVCEQPRRLRWHHVIQLQHGGSNHPRNRVPICDEDHAYIHPHLPIPPVTTNEDLALAARALLREGPPLSRPRLIRVRP